MALVSRKRLASDYELYRATCLKIAVPRRGIVPFHPPTIAQKRVRRAIEAARRAGRPPRLVELKARQTGMSTDAEGRMFHMAHMGMPGTSTVVIAHKRDSGTKIFGMAKRFYRNLPPELRPAKRHFTRGLIEFEGNDSSMQVEVATEGGGRGFTALGIHLSEFAQYADPGKVMEAVLGAVPPTPDSLVIVESTPFGMNEFHDLYVQAKNPGNAWTAIFVPWFHEPRYRLPVGRSGLGDLDEEEKELRAKHGCSDEQLAWRRFKIQEYKGDKDRFRQEMPSDDRSCFLISGRPVFEADAVQWYSSFIPPEVDASVFEQQYPRRDVFWDFERGTFRFEEGESANGFLRVYEEPEDRHLYIVGFDCSEGDRGSDPSPIVVMDRMTMNVVAVWWGRLRPDLLFHKAYALSRYYNKARVIWEANNHGFTVQVEAEKFPEADFYMRPVTMDSVRRESSEKAGFFTSTATRGYLFNSVRRYVNDRLGVVRDPQMVAEMGWLRYDDRNRPEAPSGKTKDTIVAFGLVLEEHRDSGQNDLTPLPLAQRSAIAEEMQRVRASLSMGIDAKPNIDRFNVTAEELAKLDDLEYTEARRRERSGLARQV